MRDWLVHAHVPSPNFNTRKAAISMVVLHYTGLPTVEEALARLTDGGHANPVSAHYMIDEDGTVTQMVDEAHRAWHAGAACWRGERDVNSASVGIELVNPGHEWGYREFPEEQIAALLPLLADIIGRHQIALANVVGHSDVAPARKLDPGELFPWARLAWHRLALAKPKPAMRLVFDNEGAFFLALERWGYDITDGPAAIRAFQRRWRPRKIDGEIDGEIGALLFELLLERDTGLAS
ncbi:MAG: N-acetylmuramoyl-L-alanine amidase [Novosphingobium sp.]